MVAPFRFQHFWNYWGIHPGMVTASYPGPKCQQYLNMVAECTKDAATIQSFVLHKRSHGCLFRDLDCNTFLDMDGQAGTAALGFNDKAMKKMIKKGLLDTALMQRESLYLYPKDGLHKMIEEEIVKPAGPAGLDKVLFVEGSGSAGVELAVKLALLNSGNKDGLIASFAGDTHGSAGASLACAPLCHDPAGHDNPAFGFQYGRLVLPFPDIQYPLDIKAEVNKKSEEKCLSEILAMFSKEKPGAIAGLIVSPMQVLPCPSVRHTDRAQRTSRPRRNSTPSCGQSPNATTFPSSWTRSTPAWASPVTSGPTMSGSSSNLEFRDP